MTLETQMFQNVHFGSQWLLQPLTIVLLFEKAFADRQTADLRKAVVRLEPPWIQVLKEDSVTLNCEGNLGNYSTQWLHNGTSIPSQAQPSYTFKATVNDSGVYQCRIGQTSLSDPVQLEVISDWLLLQTTQLVFLEGETINLRCHSWKNKALNKVTYYQNEKPVKYLHISSNFSISKANQSHSGDYHCTGLLGRSKHSSKPVTITVQGGSATASTTSLLWYHATFCLVICLLFAVDTGLYFYVRRSLQTPVESWRKTLSVKKNSKYSAVGVKLQCTPYFDGRGIPVLSAGGHAVPWQSNWAACTSSQTLCHMLLWTAVLNLVAGTHGNSNSADLRKAVVRLEPPWIQVLKEDSVTLNCEGDPGNYSTQWLHNGTSILSQAQPSFTFKATVNDSGEYQCQIGQTSISDPVQLEVISDWLLLQTTQLVFLEGETINLRCHSWKNKALNKVTYYQNEKPVKYLHISSNFSISKANQSHSGDYHCTGLLGRSKHSSKPVTITVQEPRSSRSFPVLTIVAAVTGIAVAVIVIVLVSLICLKQKQAAALPGDPDHREMGDTLPEELGEYSVPSGNAVPVSTGPPRGLEAARSSSFVDNPPDLEEAAKTEVENTITYSLLKHPEAPDEDVEPDYQNHI
ncbi:high affinity immunoglobulin epsilon receptor subunit alpha [Sigmodon hispidus]